uniref:CCHC-type domain-containing protein n=1 Tax=Oryza punctata TaxID=4537 RepID=A0A0E0LC99_ORYPU
MARRSTRQIRGPNRLGFEEDLAHAENLDQPANIANEQNAGNDHAPARSSQQPTRTYNSNHGGSNSTTYSVGSAKKAEVECYTCHEMGHYSWQCRSNTRTPMVQSNATTGASVQGTARPQNSRSISHTSPAATQGRLNHVQIDANEEVLEVDTVGEAYEDEVPLEETDPWYEEAC